MFIKALKCCNGVLRPSRVTPLTVLATKPTAETSVSCDLCSTESYVFQMSCAQL